MGSVQYYRMSIIVSSFCLWIDVMAYVLKIHNLLRITWNKSKSLLIFFCIITISICNINNILKLNFLLFYSQKVHSASFVRLPVLNRSLTGLDKTNWCFRAHSPKPRKNLSLSLRKPSYKNISRTIEVHPNEISDVTVLLTAIVFEMFKHFRIYGVTL